jgi:sRNA-binding protein
MIGCLGGARGVRDWNGDPEMKDNLNYQMNGEKTMTIYARPYPREELENGVMHLAKKYPAAFFPDTWSRRPLSANILDELQDDGAGDVLLASASFYIRNWNYQALLQAGAERIDLNGKKAGVVTKQEEIAAQKQIQEEKAIQARKQEEQIRNVPMLQPLRTVPKPVISNPKLSRLHTLLGSADEIKTDDKPLQAVMTAAALKLLVKEAQKAIAELENGDG